MKNVRPTKHALSRRSLGFTLLEVLLAMSLAAMVLGAIALAIDVQLRTLTAGRMKVEQAQLARALLRQLSVDLRGAVYMAQETPAEPETETETEPTGGSPTSEPATTPEPESTVTDSLESITDLGYPRKTPGLYGGLDWIQVDLSRLPRPEQYVVDATAAETAMEPPSDMKTVAYYLSYAADAGGISAAAPSATSGATSTAADASGGLWRSEMGRAVGAWAQEQGLTAETDCQEPLAPEVAAVEFLYCDGLQWLDYWDSEEMAGLPVAVQITLTFTDTAAPASSLGGWLPGLSGAGEPESTVYSLTVNLPTAKPASGESMEDPLMMGF